MRALLLSVIVLTLAGRADAVNSPPAPECRTVDVATIGVIDSGLATAGDAFRFRTLADTPAGATYPAVPKGSEGRGIIIIAHHGAAGGRPGFLVIDARFVRLADGTRVPVEILPEPARDTPYMQGRTANAPGYLGIIPFAGYVTGAYNTLHHGREIVVPDGTHLRLIVGDDLVLGACRLPVPAATAAPSAAPAKTSAPAAPSAAPATPSVAPAAPAPSPASTPPR